MHTDAHEDNNAPCPAEGCASDVEPDNGRDLTDVASAEGDIGPKTAHMRPNS